MTNISFPQTDHPLAYRVWLAIHSKDKRLREVVVDVTGHQTIHLSGNVNSFELRQVAVSIARHIPGVQQVSDGIRVK